MSTPIFLKGDSRAVGRGCGHTHVSKRESDVPYIVGVGTPIVQSKLNSPYSPPAQSERGRERGRERELALIHFIVQMEKSHLREFPIAFPAHEKAGATVVLSTRIIVPNE